MTNVIHSQIESPTCSLVGCDGFGIKLSEDSASVTVAVTGEVDLATAPTLMRALRLAGAGHPPLLVVDASTLTFIGACGLGVIVAARQAQHSWSGTLVIRHPSRMLTRTLAITELTDLVETQ
jgi:anti-anti-sigma factor